MYFSIFKTNKELVLFFSINLKMEFLGLTILYSLITIGDSRVLTVKLMNDIMNLLI